MSNYNPKRFIVTAVAVAVVAGATLLAPSVASADGGPKPRPHSAPIIGTTYGGDGHGVVEREQPGFAPARGRGTTQVVDAADYVI